MAISTDLRVGGQSPAFSAPKPPFAGSVDRVQLGRQQHDEAWARQQSLRTAKRAPRHALHTDVATSTSLGKLDLGGPELPSPVPTLVPHPSRPPMDPNLRDLRDDRIYFVETDRFFNGDQSNDANVNKGDLNRWHGGDLQGLIDKADYIKSLGATCVWISPPMANENNFMNTYDGYHGYWVEDYFNTDQHMGDMNKFKEMVKTFHDRGIKVIVDLPINDTAYDNPMTKDPSKTSWFHHNGSVNDWNNDWQQQNCDIFGLPDLAQENPDVQNFLGKVQQFWIDTGIDGFRLDAVRSIPQWYWNQFDNNLHNQDGKNKITLGEFFNGDPNTLVPFQRDANMDSLEDYPLYYTMMNVFAHGGSMKELAGKTQWFNNTYPHPEKMAAFLDDQDTERFLTSCGGDKYKMKLALAYLFTTDRVPTTYYGTEQSMTSNPGDGFQTNRQDMQFNNDPDMFKYVQMLESIRNDCAPLRHGSNLEMWQDDQIYAYDRQSSEGEALVVLNNDVNRQTRDIPIRAESKLANGTQLIDVLSGQKTTIQDGKLHSVIDGHTAAIWVPV